MQTLTSKEAQNNFGSLLDKAQREPVIIRRHGRPVAVVISQEEYDRLEALEDEVWAARARQAEAAGYAGEEETRELFRKVLGQDGDAAPNK